MWVVSIVLAVLMPLVLLGCLQQKSPLVNLNWKGISWKGYGAFQRTERKPEQPDLFVYGSCVTWPSVQIHKVK